MMLLQSLRELLRDEERAGNLFVWGTCAAGATAFIAALVAIVVMR